MRYQFEFICEFHFTALKVAFMNRLAVRKLQLKNRSKLDANTNVVNLSITFMCLDKYPLFLKTFKKNC